MKYTSEIMAARVFMGGGCAGEHDCVSCGLSMRASTKYKQFIKTNFSSFDELLLSRGVYLCDSCAALMNDKDMRFKPMLYARGHRVTENYFEKLCRSHMKLFVRGGDTSGK